MSQDNQIPQISDGLNATIEFRLSSNIFRLLFKFVPPRCRRETLRLVCKRWNQICDDCIFTKEDQLVFDPPYDFQSVVPLLVRSPRKLLNLCLIRQQICWTTIEIGFWKSRGHRVESICLIDSLLNLIDLKKILAYCPNLKKLSIRYNGTKYLKKFLEKFEEYDSANFNASSVTIFQFSLEDHCMNLLTNYSLFKILSTFPSIANLEIGLPFSCVNSEEISVNSAKYISVPGVINAIHLMGRNLKQLYLRLNYTCSCHMSKFVDLSQMLPQLEKIEDLKFASFNFLDHSLFPSCTSKFSKVTLLNLPLASSRYPAKDFIILVLNTFTNLHSLQMDQIREIEVDEILLRKLLTSALKELTLHISHFSLVATANSVKNLNANEKLEKLSLCSWGTHGEEYENLFSAFVRNFKTIRDLTIHFPNDVIMQHIFKYQKHLKNLRLENCFECPKLGLVDIYDAPIVERMEDVHSICDLKDLELLQINVYNTESLINEKNLSSLVLPKLKHFELKYLDKFNIALREVQEYEPVLSASCFKKLIKALKNSPNLEYLKVHFHRAMTQMELEELLASLKQLQTIFIKDSCYHISRCLCEKQTTYDYEKLFRICSSLRAIIHNYIRFYPDVIEKQIEAFPKDFGDFMTTNRIAAQAKNTSCSIWKPNSMNIHQYPNMASSVPASVPADTSL